MNKLTLTTEKALLLNERTLTDGEIKFKINTSTTNIHGERHLVEMTVDAFVNGEWEHELSSVYHLGDRINAEYDEWLELI